MSERSSTSTMSDFRRSSPTGSIASSQSIALTPNRQLSDGEKLKKCILELVETERTYVKVHFTRNYSSMSSNYKKNLFFSACIAFEQFAGELSGAPKARNVPFLGRNQRPLWKYPGNSRFSTRFPAKPGRSSGC